MIEIMYSNEKEDLEILDRAFLNDNLEHLSFKFTQMKLDEDFVQEIWEIIIQQHVIAKELGTVSSHYQEVHKDSCQSTLRSLVMKWNYQKAGLLQIWSELLCRFARTQHFTNGNKRTALLTFAALIQNCGFRLKNNKIDKVFFAKWEEFMLNISDNNKVKTEELAIELTKEKILSNIHIKLKGESDNDIIEYSR